MIIKAKTFIQLLNLLTSELRHLIKISSFYKDRTKLRFILKWNVFFSISFNCLLFALIASAISQLP